MPGPKNDKYSQAKEPQVPVLLTGDSGAGTIRLRKSPMGVRLYVGIGRSQAGSNIILGMGKERPIEKRGPRKIRNNTNTRDAWYRALDVVGVRGHQVPVKVEEVAELGEAQRRLLDLEGGARAGVHKTVGFRQRGGLGGTSRT